MKEYEEYARVCSPYKKTEIQHNPIVWLLLVWCQFMNLLCYQLNFLSLILNINISHHNQTYKNTESQYNCMNKYLPCHLQNRVDMHWPPLPNLLYHILQVKILLYHYLKLAVVFGKAVSSFVHLASLLQDHIWCTAWRHPDATFTEPLEVLTY